MKNAQWSDALATFEAASKILSNTQMTLGMGACERALGRYVRAKGTLERSLAESAKSPSPLPRAASSKPKASSPRSIASSRASRSPSILRRPQSPSTAARSRRPAHRAISPRSSPPACSRRAGAASARQDVRDGARSGRDVVTLSRKGFTDAVVNKTLAPGSSTSLNLKLNLLPATLKVTSLQAGALVRVNDTDVGPVPVDVLRPAGNYRVQVLHEGFIPYSTLVTVRPGEEVKLRAPLEVFKPSILSRWWFWTGAVAVIGGGIAITYFATRPTPQPPPYDGGSANWVAKPSPAGFHF